VDEGAVVESPGEVEVEQWELVRALRGMLVKYRASHLQYIPGRTKKPLTTLAIRLSASVLSSQKASPVYDHRLHLSLLLTLRTLRAYRATPPV
jgi:hypothetical protein